MIKLIKSTFYKEKKTKRALIKFILKADKLSFGSECEKFETRFARWQGKKECVMFNSGSSANFALLQGLKNLGKLNKGDKVAFSAVTWSTNVMPIIQLGLLPIPVDVEINSLNVSSNNFLDVLSKHKIKAFFITNLLGFCGNIDEISKICSERNILLIEDNCESLGTVYKGKKLGNYGFAGTFSFYVGHHMSTIEGGAVCTDDSDLAQMLRLVRAHGWDRNLKSENQKRIRKKHHVLDDFYGSYSFYDLGYNIRPTEINGFLGNNQLDYVDEIISKRQNNFFKLAQKIYKNRNYYEIKYNHLDVVSNFAFPVVCRDKKMKDRLVEKCRGKIEIRPIVGGDMTNQPFYKLYVKDQKNNVPNAKIIHNNGFYLANNPELSKKELEKIEIILR